MSSLKTLYASADNLQLCQLLASPARALEKELLAADGRTGQTDRQVRVGCLAGDRRYHMVRVRGTYFVLNLFTLRSCMPHRTTVNPVNPTRYQPLSTLVNPVHPVNPVNTVNPVNPVKPCQPLSTLVNARQPLSALVNPCQPLSALSTLSTLSTLPALSTLAIPVNPVNFVRAETVFNIKRSGRTDKTATFTELLVGESRF